MTEQLGGKRSQRAPRVFRYQLYGIRRKRKLFFADENPRSARIGIRGKIMTVRGGADKTYEKNVRAGLF